MLVFYYIFSGGYIRHVIAAHQGVQVKIGTTVLRRLLLDIRAQLIITVILVVLVGSRSAVAQTPPTASKAKTEKATTNESQEVKGRAKADGTLDMRYKANKETRRRIETGTLWLKKDGTPDMRRKDNGGGRRSGKGKNRPP